jgi:hypothetical protein
MNRMVIRIGSWELDHSPLAMNETTRSPQGRLARYADPTMSRANPRRNRIDWSGSLPVSSSPTRTIGPNSPTLPSAIACRPSGEPSTPASRSTGSRVPSAVVVSASGMTTSPGWPPATWNPSPMRAARTTDIPQLMPARASGRPRIMSSRSS